MVDFNTYHIYSYSHVARSICFILMHSILEVMADKNQLGQLVHLPVHLWLLPAINVLVLPIPILNLPCSRTYNAILIGLAGQTFYCECHLKFK